MKYIFFLFFLLLSYSSFSQKDEPEKDSSSYLISQNDTIEGERFLKKINSNYFDSTHYTIQPLYNSLLQQISIHPFTKNKTGISRVEMGYCSTDYLLNITRAGTLIRYSLGNGTYQDLKLIHYQKIFRHLHFFAEYDRTKSAGFYQFQNGVKDQLKINFNSTVNSKYYLRGTYEFITLEQQENGGIKDTIDFESQNFLNPMTLAVHLSEAENQFVQHHAEIENNYTKGKLNVFNELSYHLQKRTYTDNPQAGYYDYILIDSSITADKYELNTYESETGIRTKINYFNLKLSVKTGYQNYKARSIDTLFFENSAKFNVKYKNNFALNCSYYFTGYKKNNYWFELKYNHEFAGKIKSLLAECNLYHFKPESENQFLYSNNYGWNIQLNNQTSIHSKIDLLTDYGNITLINVNILNYLYLNDEIIPEQYEDLISVLHLKYHYEKEFKKIDLNAEVAYQKILSGEDVYRLPEITAFISAGFKTHLKALQIKTGLNVYYYSAFYSNAYNPSLYAFYLQNEQKTGNYPYTGFFVLSEVGSVRIKFEAMHLNSGLLSTPYYSTLLYPNSPRNFKISFSWIFKD